MEELVVELVVGLAHVEGVECAVCQPMVDVMLPRLLRAYGVECMGGLAFVGAVAHCDGACAVGCSCLALVW